jgi:hypothetical protein
MPEIYSSSGVEVSTSYVITNRSSLTIRCLGYCSFARERAGIEFLVGFETEVILLSRTTTPVHNHGWCDSLALSPGSSGAGVTRAIADALQHAGIELEMYHAEAAPGQVSCHVQLTIYFPLP